VLGPQNIYVKLPSDAADALIRVANREWRHPKEQAALFIVEGLRRDGALPSEQADTDSGPTAALETVR
jgi:hypothetical protein